MQELAASQQRVRDADAALQALQEQPAPRSSEMDSMQARLSAAEETIASLRVRACLCHSFSRARDLIRNKRL